MYTRYIDKYQKHMDFVAICGNEMSMGMLLSTSCESRRIPKPPAAGCSFAWVGDSRTIFTVLFQSAFWKKKDETFFNKSILAGTVVFWASSCVAATASRFQSTGGAGRKELLSGKQLHEAVEAEDFEWSIQIKNKYGTNMYLQHSFGYIWPSS